LNAQSVQLTEHLQKYVFRKSNYKSYIFLDIDNAGYICYAEARFLGYQNNAKQFTMMQLIGVNGPLHFLEDCILLADQIYPNRHPTVTLITTQQINRKPEHMRDVQYLSDYWAVALAYWAHTFFSCIRPQGQ
jgi:hypothetical protein